MRTAIGRLPGEARREFNIRSRGFLGALKVTGVWIRPCWLSVAAVSTVSRNRGSIASALTEINIINRLRRFAVAMVEFDGAQCKKFVSKC